MKRVILLSVFIWTLFSSYAQVITNVVFYQAEQTIVIHYNITGARQNQYFNVEVYVSTDGGRSYTGPLKQVTGDVGMGLTAGSEKKIIWDVFDEMPEFGGQVSFDIRATVIEEQKAARTKKQRVKSPQPTKPRFFIGYNGSASAPLGITTGMAGKAGFYISARMNTKYFTETSYETNNLGYINYNEPGYYAFSSASTEKRLSIIVGPQINLSPNVKLIMGAGLSEYKLLWEIDKMQYPAEFTGNAWVVNTDESFFSVEGELGLAFYLNHFFIQAGVAFPGFKWIEPSFSAGIRF